MCEGIQASSDYVLSVKVCKGDLSFNLNVIIIQEGSRVN